MSLGAFVFKLVALAVAALLSSATAVAWSNRTGVSVTGHTRASRNVAVGSWRLHVHRLDRRSARLTITLRLRVRNKTSLRFDYTSCTGAQSRPACANETANRSSPPFLLRPGVRTLRFTSPVTYPLRGRRLSCVIAEAKDLNRGGPQMLLGPELDAQMVCPP